MALDPHSSERPRIMRPAARVAIVASTFHEELNGAMVSSAKRELQGSGISDGAVTIIWVPGSFELPLVARRLARRPDVDAVLCFGLVLKGETSHDQYVAAGAQQGITQAMMETDKPILFGVLTCDTLEQARARALPPDRGGKHDKGREVARAALETLAALDATNFKQREREIVP